jgi:ABC-2 type transport system permease protein
MCSSASRGVSCVTEAALARQQRAPAPPSWSASLTALLRADAVAQLRNYRSLFITFALPLIILLVTGSGKRSEALGGVDFRVALALTVGMVSAGTIGYSLALARDRDSGVFQRLRVTPSPTWAIMVSRWIVQLAHVLVMAIVVLVLSVLVLNATLPPQDYVFSVVVALLGSVVFLSIGQAIAGLIPSADTLNAVGRLLYIPLIGLSLFGNSDLLGTTFELVSRWSPGGCLETMFSAAMGDTAWGGQTWEALFAAICYSAVFATVGIRWFRWGSR